jgi:hypothetical protein
MLRAELQLHVHVPRPGTEQLSADAEHRHHQYGLGDHGSVGCEGLSQALQHAILDALGSMGKRCSTIGRTLTLDRDRLFLVV